MLENKTTEAASLLARTSSGREDDPEWLVLLATRDYQLGLVADATRRVERALQVDPRVPDALNLRNMLNPSRGITPR